MLTQQGRMVSLRTFRKQGIEMQALICSTVSVRCTRRRGVGGFTLIELMVVIVIIGMLAALVGPRYFDQLRKSSMKIAKAQITSLESALDQYRLDVGHYPDTEQGLAALVTKPAADTAANWQGPYLKKEVPNDPWGHPYVYSSPGQDGREYDLMSLGPDGKAGGTGTVTSW
jgi:general secretion pathway protein G